MTHVNEKSITSFDVSRVPALVRGITTNRVLKNLVPWKFKIYSKNIFHRPKAKFRQHKSFSSFFRESERRKRRIPNSGRGTFLFLENCPPPVFVSATYTASPRFSSSPGGIPAGLSRKGRTRPFMGCSFGRAATSPDQPATLVRRNWHQGQRWFLSPSLFRRLLLRPVPFEIMLSV